MQPDGLRIINTCILHAHGESDHGKKLVSSHYAPSNSDTLFIPLGSADRAAQACCTLCGASLVLSAKDLTDTRFGISGLYEIYRCGACDLEQTSPVPSLGQLKQLYEREYNFGGETQTLYTKLRERFFLSPVYRFWTRMDGDISFHLRKGSGRLLDIGCNEGRGLRIYAGNGFTVEGLELNENAARVARTAGFTVHGCLLGELKPNEGYDVAVLSNVLEHSLNPQEMLHEVYQILNSGGQLWVSCPNSRSWLRQFFGRAWINWHVPFHIFHFSPFSLDQLLKTAGFRNVKTRQITPALWIAQSLIACIFFRQGAKTRTLRSPLWTVFFMIFARLVLFPALWLGNLLGRGDCLLAVGSKP